MTDTMRAALARLRRPLPRPRRYAALAAAGAPDMETRLAADVVPLADTMRAARARLQRPIPRVAPVLTLAEFQATRTAQEAREAWAGPTGDALRAHIQVDATTYAKTERVAALATTPQEVAAMASELLNVMDNGGSFREWLDRLHDAAIERLTDSKIGPGNEAP